MNTTSSPGVDFLFHESLMVLLLSIYNILNLPLNGYVMWLILAGSKEALASDCFYLNLAIAEIFLSLSSVWFFVYAQLKLFLCFNVYMFSQGLLFTARPLFQCCICVDCYVGVIHPVSFVRFKPLRYRVASSCVAWSVALASCIYILHIYSQSLYFWVFFIQNVLILSVGLFCCLSVLWALKRSGPGEKATKKKANTMKRRAFKILLLIMTSMVINVSLSGAAIPMQCCLQTEDFIKAFMICTCLALLAGLVEPLLYLRKSGKLPCFR